MSRRNKDNAAKARKGFSKAMKWVEAGNLANRYQLLNAAQRRYAKHLVYDFGFTANMAIQTAYLIGYSDCHWNKRTSTLHYEDHPASYYGF